MTFKKNICLLIVMILLFSIASPLNVLSSEIDEEYDVVEVMKILNETELFNLKAKSAILVDSKTGAILLKSNEHDKLPIASVTKIMSMLLIMETIDGGEIKLSDKVTVSEYACGFGGSQVYLEPGEIFSYEELIKAIAIHSANDATVAVAEALAGSEEAFVARMNEKAKQLNMKNTHFLDCSGLTDVGHYSTAYDIALMSRELILKHPDILKYTSIWQDSFRNGEFGLDNRNKLVRYYDGTTGLKTGFTQAAGHCISATAERNSMHLISVIVGAPDSNTRYAEARKLLNHGFANFDLVTVDKKDTAAGEVKVKNGMYSHVNLYFKEDINILVKKGDKDKIISEKNIPEYVEAPVTEMMPIGEVIYNIEGVKQPIYKTNIYSLHSVDKATLSNLFKKLFVIWFCMGRK